ncbi:MAG: hypothetical protein JWO31_2459, partial [Phycisphaerales bacterium]|nr:hypothetical protein [Phycisphaerales bacterium]
MTLAPSPILRPAAAVMAYPLGHGGAPHGGGG